MKRFVPVTVTTLLLAASALGQTVSLDLDPDSPGVQSSAQISQGENLTVDVVISDIGVDVSIHAYEFDLDFDPSILTATGATDAGFLIAPVSTLESDTTGTDVNLLTVTLGAVGAGGDGTLARVDFLAAKKGITSLALTDVVVSAPFGVALALLEPSDTSIEVVPEPDGLMLYVLSGLLMFGWHQRLRRRSAQMRPRSRAASWLGKVVLLSLLSGGADQALAQSPDPDLNGDGAVNVLDASLVATCFGLDPNDPATDARCAVADIDQDQDLDEDDLGLVATALGQTGFPLCGNGTLEAGEQCDAEGAGCCSELCRFRRAGIVCREAAGPCDVAEACGGQDAGCPADSLAPSGTGCPDGDPCNGPETCQSGICTAGTPLNCDDGNPCTADSCNPGVGCINEPNPLNGASCDDGLFCTTNTLCNSGSCIGGLPADCSAHTSQCTSGTCNEVTDTCDATAIADGTACDDGSLCTTADTCQAGTCIGGTPPDCDDANPCTTDTCNPALGCVNDTAPVEGTACNDGSLCTTIDVCQAGTCVGSGAPSCEDGNSCTANSCAPSTGCVSESVPLDGTPCEDADPCTLTDACQDGSCVGSGAPDCDDSVLCTVDACDSATGCTHAVDPGFCDDGNACTLDSCDPMMGCSSAPVADGTGCSDGAFCNGAETCAAGNCVAGPLPCVDLAHCDETAWLCLECLDEAECDDGIFCNGAEVCSTGSCTAGVAACPGEVCDEPSRTCVAVRNYSDDFDRSALGPDWVVDNLSFAISGNELVETAPPTFAPAQMRWQGGGAGGGTGTPDQYAKIQIVGTLTTTPAGFMLRANDPSTPLAGHYEVHLTPSSGEWRWEYYNPMWVATLGSCVGGGTLAALDWIGVTVIGSGAATEVAVYRWATDPDLDGSPDPAANWGPPDCALQSAAGPFADTGQHGGIRFYGSDAAQSRADNWFLGSTSEGEEPPDGRPNDPWFGIQWSLHNTGQTGGRSDADIDALEAWETVTGSSEVVVAVLDSGVDYTHPDLVDNIWTNPNEIPGNGIDDDDNGYVDDTMGWDFYNGDNDPFDDGSGHGTHMAGIIGAIGNNGLGIAGVDHQVAIMPLKILSSGQVGTVDAAIAAIEYAVAMGAQVLSNSWAVSGAWGEPGWNQPGFSPALKSAIEAANAAGVLFVATAGNSGEDKDQVLIFPASYDNENIISVMATDETDSVPTWSSFGATSIDLAAPGVNILSTVPDVCSLLSVGGPAPCDGSGYQVASGTSMATPHVAGVAALIWARFPGIAHLEVKSRILSSADPLPPLQGITVSEGRLNAADALSLPGP